MSASVNRFDSHPVTLSKLPMMSTKLSPWLASSAQPSLAATSSNALLTHSALCLTTTFESGTECELGTNLLAEISSSIASSRSSLVTLPAKGEVIPTSSSVQLNILNNE